MKFPSIHQFRHTIRRVSDRAQYVDKDEQGNPIFDHNADVPTLRAVGTVKLHGTNAGVKLDENGNLECWSRTKVITPEDDNAGFARYVADHEDEFYAALDACAPAYQNPMIYGEWCGKGIQSGCAIHELDKMFVMFAQCRGTIEGDQDNRVWLDMECKGSGILVPQAIYKIVDFPTFQMNIDFANPAESQNALIELTKAVEAECPVAAKFGVSGVGEGIVWRLTGEHNSSDYWFKVKGDKHSVTKVKKLAEVDVEKLAEARAFAEITITEARCLQGISMLISNPTQKQTGTFIKWIVSDVIKEESDRLGDTLTTKDVTKHLSAVAREWFFKYLDAQSNL